MIFRVATWLMVFLLGASPAAQAAELLLEVDAEMRGKLSAYNQHFLHDNLYFAERSKIVRVDTSVLRRGEPFTISLFDGASIRVKPDGKPAGDSTVWTGRIVTPEVKAADLGVNQAQLDNLGLSRQQLFDAIHRLRFSITAWDVDRASGRATFAAPGRGAGVMAPPDSRAETPVKRRAFHSVLGEIAIGGVTYRLRPLERTPKYHVLYRVDPYKTFRHPEADDLSVRADEARHKADLYRQHMESLSTPHKRPTVEDLR